MTGYHFGSIQIHPRERRLVVGGRDVALGARALDVLVALAERAGSLVSKNDLLELCWPGVVVEENNLQVQVSTLRKVLGAHAIATIPGRGYRLTLTETSDGAEKQSRPMPGAPQAALDTTGDNSAVSAELYGRDNDVASLATLVRRHELVTVVGPAGIGKTRLAQAVARLLTDEFADSARIIELAPLADPALVAMTVASALGISVSDARSALNLIVQELADQQLLLVLDNCEHLLDEVDRLVAAIRKAASGVHLLATSQEVLKHPDEHVYRLGPLGVPDQATLGSARHAGAIELFMARAQACDPRLVLTEANVGAIVEICRRLDGIPLAIELAAARVPLLGIDGVRARLDERFRLLTAGSRLALRRHQTLRAALEWSHGLLSAAEQDLFAKIGVFAGSFPLESAQRLAASEQMDEWAALDHLAALVDKSLVVVEGDDAPRYRMLETTRAFALERLAASGLTQEAMRRHAEVMLTAFERAQGDQLIGLTAEAAERLAADHDNLRSALRWAAGADGDRTLAIALAGVAGAPRGYLRYVALRAEAWALCEMVRPLVDDSIPSATAARFWLASAHHGADVSPSIAIEDASRALALYRDLGDQAAICVSCYCLSFALMQVGRVDDAKAALQEALALRDRPWPPGLQVGIDNMTTLCRIEHGDLGEARLHADAYLATARHMRSVREERTALCLLAEISVLAGDVEAAATAVDQAMTSRRPSEDRLSASNRSSDGINLRNFATALTLAGRLDEAEDLYREALVRARRSFGTGAFVLVDMSTLLARRGDLKNAARVRAYAAHAYERSGRQPRRVARQLDERLCALLTDKITADVLSRLYKEGRQWSDDEACAAAFPAVARKA